MAQTLLVLGGLCSSLLFSGAALADLGWQEAVTRLNGERGKIVGCAEQMGSVAEPAKRKAAEEAYRKAKAEIDVVLNGLIGALEGKQGGPNADALEARLKASISLRTTFCQIVGAAPPTAGKRQIMHDVYKDTIKPSMDAVKALFGRRTAPASERRAITTQLEAARWPELSRVTPPR